MKDKSENTAVSGVENPFVSRNVVLCTDGKYRWVYEMKLLTDFWVLGTILKIFGGIIGAGAVIFLLVELFGSHDYLGVLKMVGIMSAILLSLSVIGYLVYAAIMGGTYCVVYTMDDKGILQEQQMKQARMLAVDAVEPPADTRKETGKTHFEGPVAIVADRKRHVRRIHRHSPFPFFLIVFSDVVSRVCGVNPLDPLFQFDAGDRHIASASAADDADIASHALDLHAVDPAGVILLHFEDVPDRKPDDHGSSSLPSPLAVFLKKGICTPRFASDSRNTIPKRNRHPRIENR